MECIIQLNVRGLKQESNSFHKVKKCVSILENVQSTHVFNLQETHLISDREIPKKFHNFDHLYHVLSSHATEHDKGAGILLFINKTEDILESESLHPGRLLYTKTKNKTSGDIKNVFSFYGKSQTSKYNIKNMLAKISNRISENHLENVMVIGDFNFVTSPLDRNNSQFSGVDNNYRHEWTKLQLECGLTDAFRVSNPKKRAYTYRHTNGKSCSRIDRIYLSSECTGKIISNKFEYSSESDHQIVHMNLAKKVSIGPSQWIFNNTLLQDEKFTTEIEEIIRSFTECKDDFQSKRVLWDFLKQNIASAAKAFSICKSRQEKKHIENIRYELEVLDTLGPEDKSIEIINRIEYLKEEECSYLTKKIQGSLLRSKLPGIEEGEFNLAYCSKLEKMKGEQNTIFSLMNNSGQLVEGTEKVIDVTYQFYKELYSKELEDTDAQDFFLQGVEKKLSEEDRRKLDDDFTKEEFQEALHELKKDKSPGCDGLTKEFYDFFWEKLQDLYVECIKEVEEVGELSELQKVGLIRISYKKNGRIHIGNYRPITLLNVDLKVLTRALAKRMMTVLPYLIHDNQTCVPGRKITKNIHIVQDLIDHINNIKGKGAFIFLDQEKAFDRISHSFMLKTLKAFGFGPRFINWVRIVYTDTKSAVKVNGFLTPEFSIQRGVRQGCPLSALLYVLCAEVLGIAIRASSEIEGFKFNGKEHKLSQYADDMTVYIRTMEALHALFKLLRKYEDATNAKLNVSKSEGLWVGQWKGNEEKPLDLKWTSTSVKFTGIYVGNDRSACSLQGFSEVLDKIKNKLAYWKGKYLSLKGRIKVLNIFVLSKVWYVIECQDIPNVLKKDLNKMIADYIWNDLHQRELGVLYLSLAEGGLNLQDPNIKSEVFRIKWLCQVLQSDDSSIESFLVNSLIGVHEKIKGLRILVSSNAYDKKINNDFYKNAVENFRRLDVKFYPKDIHSIRRNWIYNSQILTDSNGLCFKPPPRFPAYAPEFFCDLPVTIHPRELRGVYRSLIPKLNLAFHHIRYSDSEKDVYKIVVKEEEKVLFGMSFGELYEVIRNRKTKPSKLWVGKWEDDTGVIEDDWVNIWNNVHCNLLNPRIQSTLWECTHRNYMCAYFASMVFGDSAKCKLCYETQHSRTHIFTNCEAILRCHSHFLQFSSNLVNINSVNLMERAFGLKVEENDKKGMLRNYIHFSVRHIVFRNRYRSLSKNLLSTVRILIKRISCFIRNDLEQKFHHAKANNCIDDFESKFLIDNVLGVIIDNSLIVKDLT